MQRTEAPEIRQFEMHRNLLRDVIERQAGTLDKAVLEGAMNLIEAGATRGEIKLTRNKLTIRDDGAGFQTREEILEAFEVFGKSEERKKVAGKWARFQMGRGQIFAFGKTVYRTHTFEMTVDIRDEKLGLGYALHENLKDVPGCLVTVELYDELNPYQIADYTKSVARNVKYVGVPILFNGECVSVDPANEKWTTVTDDAYMRINGGSTTIRVYNLGVYVHDEYGRGSGGIVVSRKQLDLNFARNDILRSCPVWKKISKYFREKTEKDLLDKRNPTVEDVQEILSMFESGECSVDQLSQIPIFKATNGQRIKPKDLQNWPIFSFDKAGSVKGDKAIQSRLAIVLDEDHSLCAMSASTLSELAKIIRRLLGELNLPVPAHLPKEKIYLGIDDSTEIIADRKLSKPEMIALHILRRHFGAPNAQALTSSWYNGGRPRAHKVKPRNILIGRAPSMVAWTDGGTFIALEREAWRELIKKHEGWAEIILLIAHEYAHDGSERTHNAEFYERAHDLAFDFIPHLRYMYRDYVKKLSKNGGGTGLQTHRSMSLDIEKLEGNFIDEDVEDEQPPIAAFASV